MRIKQELGNRQARRPRKAAETMQEKPAAQQNHPVNAVLRPDETFRELARKVEYCEITWPQSYVMGEPIKIKGGDDRPRAGPTDDTARAREAR